MTVNYSLVKNIKKDSILIDGVLTIDEEGTDGYKSDFFTVGDETYFQDFNVEIKKKINKKWKGTLKYLNQRQKKQDYLLEQEKNKCTDDDLFADLKSKGFIKYKVQNEVKFLVLSVASYLMKLISLVKSYAYL